MIFTSTQERYEENFAILLCSCQSSKKDKNGQVSALGKGWELMPSKQEYVDAEKAQIYDHSGDDGKEDPPVPIPNTEVKLFYAESTYG